MTWTCDGKFVKDSLADIGETITIRVIDTTSYNKWGDATTSYTDIDITAVVTTITSAESMERESQFSTGDVVLITAGENENIVVTGNRVIWDGNTYEIDRVFKNRASGITYLVESTIRKV